MSFLRDRAHHLIDQLSDEELPILWAVLSDAYYDLYALRAVQSSKSTLRPGDTFTREEALRFLAIR